MTNKIDIRKYTFKGDETLFLDTNIWYFIYGPTPIRSKPDEDVSRNLYSKAFKKIQENKCFIYIDTLIISEFVNAFARDMWKRYNWSQPEDSKLNYKDYRKTPDFKSKVNTIINETKKIFKDANKCNSDFESMDFDSFFIEFGKCNLDLNDIIYGDLCKTKGFTLVTNDKDFKSCSIPIMTVNNELLGKS
jgi:predicted nucleic acid-binding protein